MNNKLIVHGIILSSTPVGEADRRLVLLTGECGKISAFARGARRPNSSLVGATRPFAYGEITLFAGRNSYTVDGFNGINFFKEVSEDLEKSCYASYFVEFASYYAREGLEAKEIVRLLYASLRALEVGEIPLPLIRAIFELKLMTINGEYSEEMMGEGGEAAKYAWNYVIKSPMESVFKFNLEKGPMDELLKAVDKLKKYFVDYNFKSLEVMERMR